MFKTFFIIIDINLMFCRFCSLFVVWATTCEPALLSCGTLFLEWWEVWCGLNLNAKADCAPWWEGECVSGRGVKKREWLSADG